MGLEKNNFATFLSIGDGKITRRVKQPTEISSTRVTKKGQTIHEEIFDAVAGMLTDIKIHKHPEYGKFWNVFLHDDTDDSDYVLQMDYSSGYASAFLKCLPNVDFTKRIRLIPSMKTIDGKKKVTLFVTQEGEAVKHAFTKDNPNGLPRMVQQKVKGEMKWDDSDMMEFLEKMVNEQILPNLPKPKKATPAPQEKTTGPAPKSDVKQNAPEGPDDQFADIPEPADDLPF